MEEDYASTTRCNACGKDARDSLCGKCRTVAYCSQACIASDWRQHKPCCQSARLKNAVKDLMRREIAWMRSLPTRVKRHLAEENILECFRYNHHLYFVVFALVLGGVLPCHYHDVPESDKWPLYIEQFSANVLRPWFTAHQRILEMKGFRLHFFNSPLEFCACEALPRQAIGCQDPVRMVAAPLFWNSRHADAPVIQQAFFQSDERVARDVHDSGDYFFEVLRYLGVTSSYLSRARKPNVVPVKFDIVSVEIAM